MAFNYWCNLWFMMTISVLILKFVALVHGQEQVPCFFIMGDSLVDNGNNNNLLTASKSNYPPYGIDFPSGPTGRFTNGRNVPDILAGLLRFNSSIPPFTTTKGIHILKGVNYGSGAAGIRDETAKHQGDRISLNRQLLYHKVTISRIAILLANVSEAKDYLNKCLYAVNIGSNDYINNYLLPQYYPTSHLFTPDQYAGILIKQYSQQLKTLYNFGARKIAVFGLGQIGCTPAILGTRSSNGSSCVDSVNVVVGLFNDRLKPLIDDLNINLPDAKFTFINITSISTGVVSAVGTIVKDAPCCEVSPVLPKGQCIVGQIPCANRTTHVFYDNFHPTETVNLIIATRSYDAVLPTDAYPFDIQTLVNM